MSESVSRVIGDTLYKRHSTPYAFDIKVHTLGSHIEAVAVPRYSWVEVETLSPQALQDMQSAASQVFIDGEWSPCPPRLTLDEVTQIDRERSARRARANVRRRVKLFELDCMLTLTYKENVLDRERIRRDVDAMLKRMRRLVPDFSYVCVFERQKRGAWHAHIACRKIQSHYYRRGQLVPSFTLLRTFWRAVVGVAGGNIDVSRQRAAKRSVGRLAGYLSKYIGKGFEDGQDGDSYSASGSLPKPATTRFDGSCPYAAKDELIRRVLALFPTGCCEFYCAMISESASYAAASP